MSFRGKLSTDRNVSDASNSVTKTEHSTPHNILRTVSGAVDLMCIKESNEERLIFTRFNILLLKYIYSFRYAVSNV